MTAARIKICGLTREADVDAVAAAGVDAVGFVLWPGSPRAVSPGRAARLGRRLPPWTARVGVMVGPTADEAAAAVREGGLTALQLHGVEDPAPFAGLPVPLVVVRTLDLAERGPTPAGAMLMLDAHDPARHGGTGQPIDWDRAARLAAREPLILAGGLTAGNVAEAIRLVRPWGLDVSSGVEEAPGAKSSERIAQFVAAARRAISEVLP